jgi:DNA-binding NarL/FixJ family response regulator
MKQPNEESEISKLVLVMGYIAVKEMKSITEKVIILDSLGYTNKQMAIICNTTEGTIKVQKATAKKRKKQK